jgi:uncharacterized protein YbjT (DUF2867 family)
MDIETVCIFGASGFVGRSVAEEACARGYRVRAVTRNAPRARHLTVLPTCEVVVADLRDDAALARCLDGVDAAVNLVGILHESRGATFEAVHGELPARIARACRAEGVRQLLHMSALGASASGPSAYQRSKAKGEEGVRAAGADLPFAIMRPSIIFGEHDRFLNLFATMVKLFPVLPLAGARARFQPIWVEDVARAFVAALGNPRTFGETYELCGPQVRTLEELVRYAAASVGRSARIVELPASIAAMQAFVFEHLPGKLITRDNLRSMSVDNVASGPFPAVFGFAPSSLDAVVPDYMHGGARARYDRYRHFAGRQRHAR